MLLAGLLLVLFVATAAVVPVLISPSDSKPEAAPGPTAAPTTTPPPVSTQAPTPTATATPTRTVSPFLVRPAVRPRPVRDVPNRVWREFQNVCAPDRQSSRSPLTGLAPAGRKVDYLFAGSTATTLPVPGQLPAGSTSCLTAADRSLYWVPVVRQGGKTLRPDTFDLFYKAAVNDYTSVQSYPVGLRMIVGGPGGQDAPEKGLVSWSCTDYTDQKLPSPAQCRPGDRLTMHLTGPSCWDGRHLDVAGHRRHLAWATQGRCPSSHPVVVPEMVLRIAYPLSGSGNFSVASGPGEEFGFGFIAGWQKSAQAKLIKDCINAGELCDADGRPTDAWTPAP